MIGRNDQQGGCVTAENRGSIEVLIIDDDADFRDLIRAYLPPCEFAVTEAPDGVAAMRRIAENRFDLIVLDLVMPEKEGLELIPAIRGSSPNSRILAVSGVPMRSLYLKIADYVGADMV